jgi:hypothetical protein
MQMETSSGSTRVVVDEGTSLDLHMTDAGSGSIRVEVPDGYPLRVDVRDSGSGSVQVPPEAERTVTRRDRREGVWEAGDLSGSGPKALIRIDDMGSGSFSASYR